MKAINTGETIEVIQPTRIEVVEIDRGRVWVKIVPIDADEATEVQIRELPLSVRRGRVLQSQNLAV